MRLGTVQGCLELCIFPLVTSVWSLTLFPTLFSASTTVSEYEGITGAEKSGILCGDQHGESSGHLGEAGGKPLSSLKNHNMGALPWTTSPPTWVSRTGQRSQLSGDPSGPPRPATLPIALP